MAHFQYSCYMYAHVLIHYCALHYCIYKYSVIINCQWNNIFQFQSCSFIIENVYPKSSTLHTLNNDWLLNQNSEIVVFKRQLKQLKNGMLLQFKKSLSTIIFCKPIIMKHWFNVPNFPFYIYIHLSKDYAPA